MPPGGALGEQRNGQHPAAEMDPAPGAAGREQECRHYHCAGVGVGPANLSSVLPIAFDGTFALRTTCRTVTAANVVTGVGTRRWVPEHARGMLGETQFQVSEFVTRTRWLWSRRVAVGGGGQ